MRRGYLLARFGQAERALMPGELPACANGPGPTLGGKALGPLARLQACGLALTFSVLQGAAFFLAVFLAAGAWGTPRGGLVAAGVSGAGIEVETGMGAGASPVVPPVVLNADVAPNVTGLGVAIVVSAAWSALLRPTTRAADVTGL